MTKVNLNNKNETSSEVFPSEIYKLGVISFFIKKMFNVSMIFKIKISQFYD